jgi:hypothetical protein
MKYTLIVCAILLFGCTNSNTSTQETPTSQESNANSEIKSQSLANQFLGIYHGQQPSYFMKNQYGDDMIVNGNKVSVPGIDYKFNLKENGVANLQQTSLEDNSRYYYDGTYSITQEDTNKLIIECKMSDGKTSFPTYTLTIEKASAKGTCKGSNEPEFEIERTK